MLEIHKHYKIVSLLFPENSTRKNYFLASCKFLDNEVDLDIVNIAAPFGGLIGIDVSILENIFNGIKVIRLHAVLHDAAGFMRSYDPNIGPGYCYAFRRFPINSCFLGHISGIFYCACFKIFSEKNVFLSPCLDSRVFVQFQEMGTNERDSKLTVFNQEMTSNERDSKLTFFNPFLECGSVSLDFDALKIIPDSYSRSVIRAYDSSPNPLQLHFHHYDSEEQRLKPNVFLLDHL